MSFLWRQLKNRLINIKRPSPRRSFITMSKVFIKRTSPLISFDFLHCGISGGMTVEAAFILPIFLFFFVNLGSAMEMIRLHGNLQLALWDVGNRICLYGPAAQEPGNENHEFWSKVGDLSISYLYVKNQVVKYVGEPYLEESPLVYGAKGLQFWESDILSGNDTIEVVMTYQVAPWMQIPAVAPFRMVNHYYGRLWTGYEVRAPVKDVVYITDYASVYHESLECTHLKLSIRAISPSELDTVRNSEGRRYTMCAKCKSAPQEGVIYICPEGDCYHYSIQCSGLKRTIHEIPREEASKYRPCSRCAKGKN